MHIFSLSLQISTPSLEKHEYNIWHMRTLLLGELRTASHSLALQATCHSLPQCRKLKLQEHICFLESKVDPMCQQAPHTCSETFPLCF